MCVRVCDTAVIKPYRVRFGYFIFYYCFGFLHFTFVVFWPSGVTGLLLFVQSSLCCLFYCRLIQPSFYLLFVYVGAPVVCPSFISTDACCFIFTQKCVSVCLGLTLNAAFMSSLTFPPSSAFVSSPHLLYRRWSER